MNNLSPAPSALEVVQKTLRNLTKRDPFYDSEGRSYRITVEIEPSANGPETVTLRIKLSSTDSASFSIGSAIACPRDMLKSHMSALIEEAGAQGFVLAESKDTLRTKAVDFLKDNPLPKPDKLVRVPAAVRKHTVQEKPEKSKKLKHVESVPMLQETQITIPKNYTPPENMQALYNALQEIQKPYTLKRFSITPNQDSKKCTVFVGFKLGNNDEVSCVKSINNATTESSIHGYIVKPAIKQDILATIAAVTKVPPNMLESLATNGARSTYKTQTTYTGR